MNRRLYRSDTNKMLAGVCAGVAEYLGVDALWVRLFFVLLALPGGGIGVVLYFILWVIVPYPGGTHASAGTAMHGVAEIAGRARVMGEDVATSLRDPNPQAGLIVGIALIVLGILFLLNQLNLPWLFWLRPGLMWPVLLIIGGAALLWRRMTENR